MYAWKIHKVSSALRCSERRASKKSSTGIIHSRDVLGELILTTCLTGPASVLPPRQREAQRAQSYQADIHLDKLPILFNSSVMAQVHRLLMHLCRCVADRLIESRQAASNAQQRDSKAHPFHLSGHQLPLRHFTLFGFSRVMHAFNIFALLHPLVSCICHRVLARKDRSSDHYI